MTVAMSPNAARRTRGSQRLPSGPRAAVARVVAGLLAAAAVAGVPEAGAQLCSWGGTPSLPAPEVAHLSSRSGVARAPGRLAVDADNNLYVTDPTTGRVVVEDVHGQVTAVLGDLGVPLAVAVDALGRVYVGDRSAGRVERFDSQWQPAGPLGQGDGEFQGVTDVAVDPDAGLGLVYVADGEADLIKVYGPDGDWLRSFGGTGSGAGELDFPSAVWVSPAGEVFVGDQNNDRVQVFDRQGGFVRCFGAQGGSNRSFGRIFGIVGDDQGRLFVADGFQGHVRVFDPAGAVLAEIGDLGDLPGQFRTPFGLVIDGHGRLFVTSVNGGRVESFGIDDFTEPPSAGAIFNDGFESGDLHVWSAAAP